MSYLDKVQAEHRTKALFRDVAVRTFTAIGVSKILQHKKLSEPWNGNLIRVTSELSRFHDVLVLAHYDPDQTLTRADLYLIERFREIGFEVILSTTAVHGEEGHGKIWSQFHSVIDCLITRPNEGFDFGSWAAAINSLDLGTKVRGRLVLMNNSVYGPFSPLSEVLSSWNPACEILGMTSSNEFQSHVQSYFLGFRSSACSSSAFRDFWNREFHESNKWLTIVRSEMRWAQYFERNRFSICVKYTADRKFRRNPLTFRWFELLREGMPFLKKSLFSQNYDQIDLTAWEEKLESLDSDFPISAMKS